MSASTCSSCGASANPNDLSMSLDGGGMICQSCSFAAKAIQEKRGTRKAYLVGAVIVGAALLYVAMRVFVAANR